MYKVTRHVDQNTLIKCTPPKVRRGKELTVDMIAMNVSLACTLSLPF